MQALDINKLLMATIIVLEHYKGLGLETVPLDKDYYWFIPSEKVYDVYQEPQGKDFTVGQLYDDLDQIDKIISGGDMPTKQHLIWLSSLIRFLGENLDEKFT